MTKLEEKLIDLLFEKYTETKERSRDSYETAIYKVDEFRKELMEILDLIYPNKTSCPPNMLFKGGLNND